MNPQNYRRGTSLRVFWVDSSQKAGWQYAKVHPVQIERVMTTGHVVNCSEDGIAMTSSLSHYGGVLGLVNIPWACVTNVRELEDKDGEALLFLL